MNLTAALSQDVAVVGDASPCSRAGQLDRGWSCFRGRGDQYHGNPNASRLPTAVATGPTRLLLGIELPYEAVVLGARAGWAFRGLGPPADGQDRVLPFSIEATGSTKLFGNRAFSLNAMAVFGARILDAYARINVTEDRSQPPSAYQLDNPDRQTLSAYKRMGTGFIGIGLSAMFALTPSTALRFELPVSYFFPSPGVAFSPTLVLLVGL